MATKNLEKHLSLLRIAARELQDAGPQACAPYAKSIQLVAELTDCLSRKAYERIFELDEERRRAYVPK